MVNGERLRLDEADTGDIPGGAWARISAGGSGRRDDWVAGASR